MITYEKNPPKLAVGDDVKTYDDGRDGRPTKWATGIVTEVGDETFVVEWSDLEDETEYRWAEVDIEGNQIFDPKRKNQTPDLL